VIKIVPYTACAFADKCKQINTIFDETSIAPPLAGTLERIEFHWRWLGRYLTEEPEHSFIAIAENTRIVGYLAGSIADPAQRPEFDDLKYFRAFAHITPLYPAHLHINVAHDMRSAGVGAQLVTAFAAHALGHGAAGMHIVTGKGMRNVDFYLRNGFQELASTTNKGREVILLARTLGNEKSMV